MRKLMKLRTCLAIWGMITGTAFGQWRVVSEQDGRQSYPQRFPDHGKPIEVGAEWPRDQRFRWLVAELEIR